MLPPQTLQLVRHLRQQGFFVCTALTRPFDFEGARRMEQADALIGLMEEVAHLVVRQRSPAQPSTAHRAGACANSQCAPLWGRRCGHASKRCAEHACMHMVQPPVSSVR